MADTSTEEVAYWAQGIAEDAKYAGDVCEETAVLLMALAAERDALCGQVAAHKLLAMAHAGEISSLRRQVQALREVVERAPPDPPAYVQM